MAWRPPLPLVAVVVPLPCRPSGLLEVLEVKGALVWLEVEEREKSGTGPSSSNPLSWNLLRLGRGQKKSALWA